MGPVELVASAETGSAASRRRRAANGRRRISTPFEQMGLARLLKNKKKQARL